MLLGPNGGNVGKAMQNDDKAKAKKLADWFDRMKDAFEPEVIFGPGECEIIALALHAFAEQDRQAAEQFKWLVKTAPEQLALIAWRYPSACVIESKDVREIIAAAMKEDASARIPAQGAFE